VEVVNGCRALGTMEKLVIGLSLPSLFVSRNAAALQLLTERKEYCEVIEYILGFDRCCCCRLLVFDAMMKRVRHGFSLPVCGAPGTVEDDDSNQRINLCV
jgi:hypothetical protein